MIIYANKSLGLRRGKWASQMAHAVMKHFLMACHHDKELNAYVVPEATFNYFSKLIARSLSSDDSIKIKWVKDPDELDELEAQCAPYSVSIVDHARTELKEPTKTCFSHDESQSLKLYDELEFSNAEYQTKQVIALSREANKSLQYQLAVTLSLASLMDRIVDKDGLKIIRLDKGDTAQWLTGAFAKITVKYSNTAEIVGTISDAKEKGIPVRTADKDNEIYAVVFGATKVSDLDAVTGHLKLY